MRHYERHQTDCHIQNIAIVKRWLNHSRCSIKQFHTMMLKPMVLKPFRNRVNVYISTKFGDKHIWILLRYQTSHDLVLLKVILYFLTFFEIFWGLCFTFEGFLRTSTMTSASRSPLPLPRRPTSWQLLEDRREILSKWLGRTFLWWVLRGGFCRILHGVYGILKDFYSDLARGLAWGL